MLGVGVWVRGTRDWELGVRVGSWGIGLGVGFGLGY